MSYITQFTPKQARDYVGLKQEEVAQKLGISRFTYAKLEEEPERFTIAQSRKFAEIVNMPYSQILF